MTASSRGRPDDPPSVQSLASSPPLPAARPSLSPADLTRRPASLPPQDQLRIPPSVVSRSSVKEGVAEPAQRTVQDLFNLQTKFLKTELHSLGVSVRKRLLEQDAEISALRATVRELKARRNSDGSEQTDVSVTAVPGTSSGTRSDDILHSFASLIAMYAQPVEVGASNVAKPILPHANGSRLTLTAAGGDAQSCNGHEAI